MRSCRWCGRCRSCRSSNCRARRKGGKPRPTQDLIALLAPATRGHDVGLLSEAGLAAVADPGAALVQAAHAQRLNVVSLPGPSSSAARPCRERPERPGLCVCRLPADPSHRANATHPRTGAAVKPRWPHPADDRNAVPKSSLARWPAHRTAAHHPAVRELWPHVGGGIHTHAQRYRMACGEGNVAQQHSGGFLLLAGTAA